MQEILVIGGVPFLDQLIIPREGILQSEVQDRIDQIKNVKIILLLFKKGIQNKNRIGETSPPKFDLDRHPTRDQKADKSMRIIKLTQGPIAGGLRFKDQAAYEQRILNLEEEIKNRKSKYK